MAVLVVSDAAIAAMTPAERRLEKPLDELVPPAVQARSRRLRLGLMIAGAIALIPWLVFLAITLPSTYIAHNWPITWVGFDAMLIGFTAATAVLGLLRRQLLVLTAFATGVLLICDAWFDVMTAGPDTLSLSVATALLAELPVFRCGVRLHPHEWGLNDWGHQRMTAAPGVAEDRMILVGPRSVVMCRCHVDIAAL